MIFDQLNLSHQFLFFDYLYVFLDLSIAHELLLFHISLNFLELIYNLRQMLVLKQIPNCNCQSVGLKQKKKIQKTYIINNIKNH